MDGGGGNGVLCILALELLAISFKTGLQKASSNSNSSASELGPLI